MMYPEAQSVECDQILLSVSRVKSQYPTERGNVETRQKEIQQVWLRCQAQAAERRSRLESAVGHQVFGSSSAQLHDWLQVRILATLRFLFIDITNKKMVED